MYISNHFISFGEIKDNCAKSAIVFFQSLSKLVYNEASWMNETHLYNGLVYGV
jgi:hypothetical protein